MQKKVSTTKRGNYYKRKTKKWYESQGYTVQLTEFMCATMIGKKCIYRKIDIFGSDGIAMNGQDIIFWNSKHVGDDAEFAKASYQNQVRKAKKEFELYPFPKHVHRAIIMWHMRKKQPEVIEVSSTQ